MTRSFKKIPKLVTLIGILLLSILLLVRIIDPLILKSIRLSTFDYYQVIKPREYVPQPLIIVDLDEASLREFGQWPWPRTRIADLINGIAERGGVATGFDIIFSEPDRLSPSQIAKDNANLPSSIQQTLKALPDNEVAMANAMKNHLVILGQASVRNASDDNKVPREIQSVGVVKLGEDPTPFLRQNKQNDLVQNIKILEDAASGLGHFSINLETDDIVRRVPLVAMFSNKIRFALSVELLRIATGGESIVINTDVSGIQGIKVAGNLIETDKFGNVWPYFSNAQQSRYVSAGAILNGSVTPDILNGKMVLVGTSVTGLEDYRATPLRVSMPGVEIHAQIIENIMAGEFLKRPSILMLVELIFALLAGLLVIIFVPRLTATKSALSFIILGASIFVFSWWSFASHHTLLDATFPIIVITLLFMMMSTANYMREERQKQRIRGAFGQYLSPTLVDQLTENPEKLVLGGESRELSILFSDIRGFTTLSEQYSNDPEGLTKLMNAVLTKLSQPILEQNGTIDKYLGDAVMAFWNAPIDEDDHAYLACVAALQMIEKINSMNASHTKKSLNKEHYKLHEINIGIGINTGECIVGNMGSDTRFDYTALGDPVNIASRLEGQSKPYGVPIVIGEKTARLVQERLAIFEIDLIRVVGKSEPLHIYALAGDEDLATSEEYKAFRALNTSMLSSFRLQDWQSALDALGMLEDLNKNLALPIEDYLFIYQTRIEEFASNPPSKDWDGVHSALSK